MTPPHTFSLTDEDIDYLLNGIGWWQSEINHTPKRLDEIKDWLKTKQILSALKIQEKIQKRIDELKKEDDEDLKLTVEGFPNWSKEQYETVHNIENYNKIIIHELKELLEVEK